MKRVNFLHLCLILLPVSLLYACGSSSTTPVGDSANPANDPAGSRVMIRTTLGDIVVELNDTKAPLTVDNFLQYLDNGQYDSTIFHRVIAGFMIQGGGFTSSLVKKQTAAAIINEADNGLLNTAYSIAMARTSEPHSATAQFFINATDNAFLNHTAPTSDGWGYTVFGEVVDGRDVVDLISSVETTSMGPFAADVPVTPVVIQSITRIE